MPKLTKRTLDSLKAGSAELWCWDSELPGFGVRVKPSGTKTFLIQYRNRNGRTRRYALGKFGVLTVEQARQEARQKLTAVARGEDVSANRKADRNATTMDALCAEYLERAEAGHVITRRRSAKKASTLYIDRGRIERHIIPLLGKKAVSGLTSADMRAFLRDVTAGKTKADVKTEKGRAIVEGGRGTASRTLGLLGGILSYAVQEGYRADNPVRGVVRPADEHRKVRLDPAGYKTLGKCLKAATAAGEPWQALMATRLIALTGCRRGEIEHLKRAEVDLEGQALRLGDSKTGESVRPIGAAAVTVLKEAMQRSRGEFVFPSDRKDKSSFQGLRRAWERMIGDALSNVTPHGLRHSFASVADDLAFPHRPLARC